jgi:hypothetical protein
MNYVQKMNKLADRLEAKLIRMAQANEESNQKPVVEDAFFRWQDKNKSHETFFQKISQKESAFQQAAASVDGKITIGAKVSGPNKSAEFLVKCPDSPDQEANVKAALIKDFQSDYGLRPDEFFRWKLKENLVYPPNVNNSWENIIEF